MGSGVTLICPESSYKKSFGFGVGFAYSSLENVIDLVHHKRRPIIQDILDNHEVGGTQYEHALFACKKCGELYGRFYVRIEYDDGKVYESV